MRLSELYMATVHINVHFPATLLSMQDYSSCHRLPNTDLLVTVVIGLQDLLFLIAMSSRSKISLPELVPSFRGCAVAQSKGNRFFRYLNILREEKAERLVLCIWGMISAITDSLFHLANLMSKRKVSDN